MKKFLFLSMLAACAISAQAVTVSLSDCCYGGNPTNLPEGWSVVDKESATFTNYSQGGMRIVQIDEYGYAYLITPVISGTFSFEYFLDEAYDYDYYGDSGGEIYIYEATESGNGFTINTASSLWYDYVNTNSWNTKEYSNLTEPTHIAIRLNNGVIRNFTYEEGTAEQPAYSFSLSDFKTPEGLTSFVADENGNVAVSMTANITNTGTETLRDGVEGYTFSLSESSCGELCSLSTDGSVIAPGETKNVTFSGSFPISIIEAQKDLSSNGAYWIQLILKSPLLKGQASKWFDIYPWALNYKFVLAGSTEEINSVNFGFVNDNTPAKNVTFTNMGARPINVTSINLPTGFTLDVQAPFTLQPVSNSMGRSQVLEIGVDRTASGILSGDIEFTVESLDTPVKFNVAAVIPGPGFYYEDFENDSKPAGWIIDNSLSINTGDETQLGTGNTKALDNTKSTEMLRAITPMLSFNQGDKFVFQAGAHSYNGRDPQVTVYYSTNRSDWTKIANIRTNGYMQEGDLAFPNTRAGYNFDSILGTYFIDAPEGNGYFAFDINYARIDNLFGGQLVNVTHDLMFSNSAISEYATVNIEYTPAVTVTNVAANAEAADSYQMTLLVDGENVVTLNETPEIAAGGNATFTLPYTFHEIGNHTVAVELRAGEYTLATAPVTVSVAEETASGMKTVGIGDLTNTNYSNKTTPFRFYDKKSQSIMIFTEEYLSQYGIAPGTKLTGVSFNGLFPEKDDMHGPVNVWIIPTEKATVEPADAADLLPLFTNDNLVFSNDDYYSANTSSSQPDVIFELPFHAPYIYNGGNLMICLSNQFTTYNSSAAFVVDNSEAMCARAIMRSSDTDINSTQFIQATGFGQTNFYYALDPAKYEGTVVNSTDNQPIAGAKITLTSGNVVYNGESADNGTFSIEVIQGEKLYDVTVEKADFNIYMTTASFEDGNINTTIELVPEGGTGIAGVDADKVNIRIADQTIFVDGVQNAELAVFNTAGMMCAKAKGESISIADITPGVYLLNIASANGNASVKFVKR